MAEETKTANNPKDAAQAPEGKGSSKLQEEANKSLSNSIDAMFSGGRPDPEVEQRGRPSIDDEQDETDKLIDRALDDEREKKRAAESEERPAEPEEPEEPEEPADPVDPTSEPAAESDDDDYDFDAPLEGRKVEDADEDGDDDGSSRSVATMREQLQLRGREAKEAKQKLKEAQLELERVRREAEEAKAAAPPAAAADPWKNPEIARERQRLIEERDAFTSLLPTAERNAFAGKFEDLLRDFADAQNSTNAEQRDAMLDTLRNTIGDTVGDEHVTEAMRMLRSNRGTYVSLIEKISNFRTEADSWQKKQQKEGWQKSREEIESSIRPVAEVDDSVIESTPDAPAAFVAKMVKSDPAWAKRAEKAKEAVAEAFLGKRPLDDDELQQLKDAEASDGMSLDAFLKERRKGEEKNRSASMRRLYLSLMLGSELPGLIRDAQAYRDGKKTSSEEKDALLDHAGKERKSPAKKPEEKPQRAQDRPSAIEKYLEEMGG